MFIYTVFSFYKEYYKQQSRLPDTQDHNDVANFEKRSMPGKVKLMGKKRTRRRQQMVMISPKQPPTISNGQRWTKC